VATSQLQSEKKPQDAAYARAQDAIATARASGASDLYLSTDLAPDLAVLPPDIGSLTALSRLYLFGTQVSDISALSGLTALSSLVLSGTQVSDISALSGLTALSSLDLRGTQVSDILALSGFVWLCLA
jgi:internalin A